MVSVSPLAVRPLAGRPQYATIVLEADGSTARNATGAADPEGLTTTLSMNF